MRPSDANPVSAKKEASLRGLTRRFLVLALSRPKLWPAMLSAAWAFRARGWYRRYPFLPLPSKEYVRWRLETAYGDPEAVPPAEELAGFLSWSANLRRQMRPERKGVAVKVAAVAALVAFAVWANLRAGEYDAVREAAASAGYLGLLAASVVSGFNLIAPIPVATFYPFLIEAGFQPLPTLATIALGMTGGDFLGYMVGDASRALAGDRIGGFRARVERLHRRHPLLPLGLLFLYAAFAPVPNELLVVPLAFMRYPLGGIMLAVFMGNMIFNTWLALGAAWLFGGGG